ncbi:histidine phosphatase family protein [Deinococcus cellulosilyticus]|uniref:Alpha-ribazole phosphatase n=1 Tax=Deinococcus cellulosilyticus (strain DSM 18568 / NBRC 106333 / KACC 11606 / 5516J-15) TaxID=1223518 RepID=A0A511N413_DEIC1|nr:histidine phosphatase family protein [Deinococcus cellulosilyticus]GEM47121.1 alpha-ribazole phosphatase [Deinococcus cellulosilyticus NBRC 106333 = KACC 11606]
MIKLTLVRHGITILNSTGRWQGHLDEPLSEEGMQQAIKLRRVLRAEDYDQIVSSDLKRAYHTATLAVPDATIMADPRLRELNFGVMEGRTLEENQQHPSYLPWKTDPFTHRPEGGESFQDLLDRALDWLSTLQEDTSVLAFSHNGFIRALASHLIGIPRQAHEPMLLPFPLNTWNTGVTLLQKRQKLWVLEKLNDTGHLLEPIPLDTALQHA